MMKTWELRNTGFIRGKKEAMSQEDSVVDKVETTAGR
jgi:hypothetical protein